METKKCGNCAVILTNRSQLKYCSNKCQIEYQYKDYIKAWKENNKSLKITTKNIPKPLKSYLLEKFKNKCSSCGWNQKHPNTGKVPLEIDHIDGNAENNFEKNLRVLCPNCHALTPNFKNLNKGKGRQWRMQKYIRNN